MGKTHILETSMKLGLAAAVLTLALPELGFAADTVGNILDRTTATQVGPAAKLLAALCYVGGAIMLVSGSLSLRKHADNPASEPMGKGITRLLVGAAIMGLPYLSGVMQQTVFAGGNTGAKYDPFSQFSN